MIQRVILLILDSVGIGALPDAEAFGDKGVNTLGNIAKHSDRLEMPALCGLGLGHIDGIDYLPKASSPLGAYGRLGEQSLGKDTTTGHWEIAGLHIKEPFKTYPDGFPKHVIDAFTAMTGREILCNKPASGTTVLDELGEEHMKTGKPIIYTSADSVFQIAAHEDIIPLDELYDMCQKSREMLMGEDVVARVIARPFIGEPGKFERTSNRRDYSLSPYEPTVLDHLKDAGYAVKAVGKIVDIYNGQGITEDVHTKDNMDGVDHTLNYMKDDFKGLIFTNFVDFDAKYGHRRDIPGYRDALEAIDKRLPEIMAAMKPTDLLMITADHGNDPAYKGTDHTREYVPLLVYGDAVKANVNLGTRDAFADIAATLSEIFEIKSTGFGKSFAKEILK